MASYLLIFLSSVNYFVSSPPCAQDHPYLCTCSVVVRRRASLCRRPGDRPLQEPVRSVGHAAGNVSPSAGADTSDRGRRRGCEDGMRPAVQERSMELQWVQLPKEGAT